MISSFKKLKSNAPSDGQHPVGRRIVFYWLPLVGFCSLIFWQSSKPSLGLPSFFPHFDKLLHFSAYYVMAILAARALTREKPGISKIRVYMFAIGFCVLFGISDEIHQSFVPGRTPSFWDVAADALGSWFGARFYLGRIFESGKSLSESTQP